MLEIKKALAEGLECSVMCTETHEIGGKLIYEDRTGKVVGVKECFTLKEFTVDMIICIPNTGLTGEGA